MAGNTWRSTVRLSSCMISPSLRVSAWLAPSFSRKLSEETSPRSGSAHCSFYIQKVWLQIRRISILAYFTSFSWDIWFKNLSKISSFSGSFGSSTGVIHIISGSRASKNHHLINLVNFLRQHFGFYFKGVVLPSSSLGMYEIVGADALSVLSSPWFISSFLQNVLSPLGIIIISRFLSIGRIRKIRGL